MLEVELGEFNLRRGIESRPEDATMNTHPDGLSGDSDVSDNDGTLMTITSKSMKDSGGEDSDENPQNHSKRRVNKLLDSDSEAENEGEVNSAGSSKESRSEKLGNNVLHSNSDIDEDTVTTNNKRKIESSGPSGSDNSSDEGLSKTVPPKSRIKRINFSDSDSDSRSRSNEHRNSIKESTDDTDVKEIKKAKKIINKSLNTDTSESENETPNKYEVQKMRTKEKKNKLHRKFKSLVTSREKGVKSTNFNETNESRVNSRNGSGEENKSNSSNSDDDAASIEKIKQKIKERTVHLKSTIYDTDTSSDEETAALKHVQKQKKPRKSMKSTSPKPMRMSAKQAMENMQKIKSESNRMLREKEVSLPYHRPKALSLKDIMSKRTPALTADGKALPIKMNEEQLKLYAQSLEQRQREVIELCRSDTEDEQEDNEDKTTSTETENKDNSENNDNLRKDNDDLETSTTNSKTDTNTDMTLQNDTLYDTLTEEINGSIVDDSKIKLDNIEDKTISGTENIDEVLKIQNDTEIPTNGNDCDDEECTENEMSLVYNDSIESVGTLIDKSSNIEPNNLETTETDDQMTETIESKQLLETSDHAYSNIESSEVDSQLISLHYDIEPLQEKPEDIYSDIQSPNKDIAVKESDVTCENEKEEMMETEEHAADEENGIDDFSDDDINMADIDDLIENAEIISNHTSNEIFDSPMLIKDPKPKTNPKLTGAPGMIIDLDGTDPTHRKLTGVQLLKERFSYFSKLKTPEEMERDREKKLKPGNKHQILKQELEDQIAEQRALEWAKRLEQEKQLHAELNAEAQGSDDENDIDKIEAKLEDRDMKENESSAESEPEENDCDITDKPVKRNPMIADEADESDCEEDEKSNINKTANDSNDEGDDNHDENEVDESDDEESSDDESEEEQTTTKKGRILKAFEDSDEELDIKENGNKSDIDIVNSIETNGIVKSTSSTSLKNTQDEDLQLAQNVKTQSEDLFTSQDSVLETDKLPAADKEYTENDDKDFGTQTFSITEGDVFKMPDRLSICDLQSQDGNLDAVVGMCSGSFSQAMTVSQLPSQLPESQIIGEDILGLCTGKFYDNPFVSQIDEKLNLDDNQKNGTSNEEALLLKDNYSIHNSKVTVTQFKENEVGQKEKDSITHDVTMDLTDLKDTRPMTDSMELNETGNTKAKDDILESILDELNEPEKKPKKYFLGDNEDKENTQSVANNIQGKKKFVIDSDEEIQKDEENTEPRKKKFKKKKLEKRALQISDDESDQSDAEQVEDEEYASDMDEENEERLVEYDSDENEVEIVPQIQKKKKQKAPEFFEQEAELTSEDEWIGSGDEDEAGLDRMEREEGDDDKFNQRQLQRELGQIHMRDVLDQDKREVRIIQELLFEDGDLGEGSRQRKFRWKNADGEEETGTVVDVLPDTQEEEFESEEQWRKQRHEREVFLREMQKQNESEDLIEMTIDQTLIKSSVTKTTSVVQESTTEIIAVEVEKTVKDIPSPKKSSFTLFKQNYHGSLLTRGQGALARLAAIASPLAADEDAPKVGTVASGRKGNFVFATLTQEDPEPKVTKRKAETNAGTPRLVKKLRTEDKSKHSKSKNSLMDHMKI